MTTEKTYWENRYINNQTGWDAGSVTTPLKEYFDQLTDKNMKILIPGAGNAYEAEYLHNTGFKNVYVLDIAQNPLDNLSMRCKDFPKDHLIQDDYFKYDGSFDLIIEQTFFCAFPPSLREAYVIKSSNLLKPGGKLAGVLFNTVFEENPPFGGYLEEYRPVFEPFFNLRVFEKCYNSIKPREGKEVFILLEKK